MEILGFIAIMVLGLVGLVLSADWFVKYAAKVGQVLGLSSIVIGMTIVAIGTSAPEIFVSVFAAHNGSTDLAIANVIGSNVFNLGIIFALMIYSCPILLGSESKRDLKILVAGALFLLLVGWLVGEANWIIGAGLFVFFSIYLIHTVRSALGDISEEKKVSTEPGSRLQLTIKLVGSLVFLLISARAVVFAAENLALAAGLSQWLIGVTIVAVGTSLPELFTVIMSIRNKDPDLGVGGLIGSDLFNFFVVLGLSAVAFPLRLGDSAMMGMGLFAATALAILILDRLRRKLHRREAIFLFGFAITRYFWEIASI